MARELGREEFIDKIFDYNKNQKWTFKGERPTIIDFYADWCGPCKMLSPVIDELEREYEGKIDFYKVNIDRENELAMIFSIQSIPTLMFIGLKDAPKISMGFHPKEALKEKIKETFGIS